MQWYPREIMHVSHFVADNSENLVVMTLFAVVTLEDA